MATKLATIRFAERSDVPDVLGMERSCHKTLGSGNRALTEASLLEFVAEDRTRFDVLVDQAGRAIGYLLFRAAEKDASIERLVVHPDERRTGCGRLLLNRAIQWARKAKVQTLSAHTYEEDETAQKFFSALGFKSSVARNHFGSGQDSIFFTAKLSDLGGGQNAISTGK